MQATIMITNNADRHPVHKWAALVAASVVALIKIDGDSDNAKKATRLKTTLEYDVQDVLESHLAASESHEQSQLAVHGHARLLHTYRPHDETLGGALADVLAVFDKPEYEMFAGHFSREVVQQTVAGYIGQAMVNQQHIERLAHAKRTPDTPEAIQFLNRHGQAHVRPEHRHDNHGHKE